MRTVILSGKTSRFTPRFLSGIGEIGAAEWNALLPSSQPFLRHEFLSALETTGCVSRASGWMPTHAILRDASGSLVAAAPAYFKRHSRGEFVFDFSWAHAYEQHGLAYYPKLVCAVPFTPVTGPRFLVAGGADRAACEAALIAALRGLLAQQSGSSWHVLFPSREEAQRLASHGLILRKDCQFHWFNAGFGSFDEFLATFTAEKRKKAKRERRRVAEAGIEFETRMGGEIDARLWKTLFAFYADTFHRHGHHPYLDLAFFTQIAASLPEHLMLKIARHGATPIAVAIFFRDSETLYGRYWGAGGNFHSLHFEACYYQGIDYCIEHGLARFEPGTQGEHKVPRGFVPTITHSAHEIRDARFAAAIRDFAAREARGVDEYAEAVNSHLPYHRKDELLRVAEP